MTYRHPMTAPGLPSLGELARAFLRVGLLGFGGPAAQIALMHRIVVDEKRWLGEARYLHALNYCMLLPGPEAQQLATYTGWLAHGVKGGLITGLLFILPGALIMLGLSALYAFHADLAWVQGLFYGIKCAVIALVVEALLRIARRALKTNGMRAVALAAFLALALFALPFPLVILAAAIIGTLIARYTPPAIAPLAIEDAAIDRAIAAGGLPHIQARSGRFWGQTVLWTALWLAPVALLLLAFGPGNVFTDLATFFARMALVTFGGAYAVLAYVAQAAVESHGWLTASQMIDGLGLAETTPGPLILVLQFVGFLAAFGAATGLDPLLAGTLGAILTLWVTFVPSFLFIFAGAPYAESLRNNRTLAAGLAAISAAVVGVIAHLALWFGLHVLFGTVTNWHAGPLDIALPDLATIDVTALALTIAALVLTLRFHLPVGWLILIFAIAGVALKLFA